MIVLIVIIVLGVLGLGSCAVCIGVGALGGSSKPTKPAGNATVYVFCEGSPAAGYTCTLTHTGGNARANACWDVRVSCHNGVLVTGRACQTVAPQGKVTRNMRPSELTNVNRCNGASSTSVENITVTALN
ncbi:MAG: hypothetical protein IT372_25560 [Polyangiaceae bacterium]|nr:hypothetical protein [Polyangiaceae bacterium]